MSTLTDFERAQGEEPLLKQGKTGARGMIRGTPQMTLQHMRDQASDQILWPDPQTFTDKDNIQLRVMTDAGLAYPLWTMQVHKVFEVPLFMMCSYLVIESYDGRNVWHNDDTWMVGESLRSVGAEVPTERTYNVYTVYRSRFGYQGIGPQGLTSLPFQNRGDFYGGSWHPRANMAGANSWFREMLDAGKTMDDIAHMYNPGSPNYPDRHKEQRGIWRKRFQDALDAA